MKIIREFALIVSLITSISVHAQYQPNWESLDQRPIPEWWKEAKFGIFIHWGLYSVPAYAPTSDVKGIYEKYAEHYENRLLLKNELFLNHHDKYYGKNFTYQDFAPMFTAKYFNSDQWADLIQKSGAKYVVLTSKHHDGFCLWPSKESPKWNSVEIGPHRDIIAELSSSVRSKGLRMGLYYSLLEWNHPLYSPSTMDKWVDEHMIPQMKDLVTNYKPEIIFADGEWDYVSEQLKSEQFLAWLYNESPVKQTVVVNDRWGKETRSKHGGYYTTEYDVVHNGKGIGDKSTYPWEESRGIGMSYGYNKFESAENYSSSKKIIDLLINKVGNGGNLLLNIGPDADGLIPVVMQEKLLAVGEWLKINGEAIYGSSAWGKRPNLSEGSVFFTMNKNQLYIICTQWPDKPININGIKSAGKVSMLGSNAVIKKSLKGNNLKIIPPIINPGHLPCDHAWVFKVDDFVSM